MVIWTTAAVSAQKSWRCQLQWLWPQVSGSILLSCIHHASASFFLLVPLLLPCLSTHHVSVCPEHLVSTLTHTLLVPMACRGCRSIHPQVTLSCARNTCPVSASKWLAPFTDEINGVVHQILKIVSKSPFFREANKDSKNGSSGRTPTYHEFKAYLSLVWLFGSFIRIVVGLAFRIGILFRNISFIQGCKRLVLWRMVYLKLENAATCCHMEKSAEGL
jgi:hypothetical protein